MIHLLEVVWGLNNANGKWYLLWSGIFPDIVIFGGVLGWYYHHTCHANKCYRFGFHKVGNSPYSTCRKHHPGMRPRGKVTLEHIYKVYKKK